MSEMLQEEVTAEPSLQGMLPKLDLTDERVRSWRRARMSEPQEEAPPTTSTKAQVASKD
jgi:hypothetical protein